MTTWISRYLKLSAFAALAFVAQPAVAADGTSYVETFDGSDKAIMLNGVIEYGADGAWSVQVQNGNLQLYNADEGSAVRYYTVPTLSYPGSQTIARTDNATVKVSLRVRGEGRSGAGIIAGFDARTKDYLLFAVGSTNQVYVIQRMRGKAKVLSAQSSDAVLADSFNTVEVRSTPEGLEFRVNGTLVVTVATSEIPGDGIGIGAFGRGSYDFDTVTIAPPSQPKPLPEPARATVPRVQEAPAASVCKLPPPSAEAEVVVVGVYEGQAISTVALAGTHRATTAARIRVEPGDTPLYVMANSYRSMLWAFEGDIARVERVILSSGVPGVGATGLGRSNIFFAEQRCLPRFYKASTNANTDVFVERVTGRNPSSTIGVYGATTISLPSGEVSDIRGEDVSPPAGFDEAVWKTGLRFSPAGLMDVETSDVVSSAEPERYDVLPSQFGLAQLAGQGKLEAVAPNKFRILGEFSHYPAGLSGAHSVTFLLPEGVTEPAGSPGHSRVERELAGEHTE